MMVETSYRPAAIATAARVIIDETVAKMNVRVCVTIWRLNSSASWRVP